MASGLTSPIFYRYASVLFSLQPVYLQQAKRPDTNKLLKLAFFASFNNLSITFFV